MGERPGAVQYDVDIAQTVFNRSSIMQREAAVRQTKTFGLRGYGGAITTR
jgi:hypothetical protein